MRLERSDFVILRMPATGGNLLIVLHSVNVVFGKEVFGKIRNANTRTDERPRLGKQRTFGEHAMPGLQ